MKNSLYLIAYDITHPPRLNRIARYLSHHAVRVQYSVFAAELRPDELRALTEDLSHLIDPKTDDIRIYPLPRSGEVALMGRQIFPDDIMLVRDGHNLFRLNQ